MWECARLSSAAVSGAAVFFAASLWSGTPAVAQSGAGGADAVYSIVHFDVIPETVNGVDFLQNAYALLFKYRDQSSGDRGLASFRVLNLVAPTTNHSEVVQVWSSQADYRRHLAEADTVAFRFDVQGNPALGGQCCIGSPIDDRQYSLVTSFGTSWFANTIPSAVGASSVLYVITYVDLLQDANPTLGERELAGYGATTFKTNGGHVLSYNILRQLDRPNRYAILEIWDTQANYAAWQGLAATTGFVARITPLLGSPFDHRLTILCGETYDDTLGCIAP